MNVGGGKPLQKPQAVVVAPAAPGAPKTLGAEFVRTHKLLKTDLKPIQRVQVEGRRHKAIVTTRRAAKEKDLIRRGELYAKAERQLVKSQDLTITKGSQIAHGAQKTLDVSRKTGQFAWRNRGGILTVVAVGGVFVIYSRLKSTVADWTPGAIADAVMEDPLSFAIVAIILGAIVWFLFFRGE